MPGADCQHLGADDLGYLFDKGRIPGRRQPNALGEDRRIPVAEPPRGLLVDDDRDAEPRMFDGDLLNSVHECCALLRVQSSRGANARDLPNTVRHLFGNGIGVEGASAHESSAPEAAELSQLLV